MFAPAIGIAEDPVTGNANGPLGAYLVHWGLIPGNHSEISFQAIQGETIGREGKILVFIKMADNKPIEVQITGEAVIAFKTEIECQ